MKKIFLLAMLAAIITLGCQPPVKTEVVDLKAIQDTITQIADTYMNAWNAEDMDVLAGLLADDGQYCGTDPSEELDKATLLEMWTKAFADSINYSYEVDQRRIRLDPSGRSAIVVEHLVIGGWSSMLHVRQTYQIIKTPADWKIDFISWGFMVKNEDVERLNKALE